MNFYEHLQDLEAKLKNPIKGIPIQLPNFNKYKRYLNHEDRILLTGTTGSHKSQVITKLFIVDIVDFIAANPNAGIKVKIYYFSIELSKYVFYCRLYNYLLGRKGIVIDLEELMSPTLQSTVDAIKGLQGELDLINKHLEVIDDIDNVDQMFKYLATDLQKYGKIDKLTDGNYTYTKFDPNQYNIVITDTVNALPSTKGESDNYNAVKKWSEIYTKIHLSKRFKCININVQQFDNSLQARQYSNSGLKIDEKHEPNLGALSTVKTTPMDHTLVIALSKPSQFKITSCDGYDIKQLGDYFLKINIMKNTFGQSGPNVSTHLYIDGATGNFEELPLSVNKAALENFMVSKGLNKLVVNKASENYLI